MYTSNPGLHPEWLSGVRLMRRASQVLTITAHGAGREMSVWLFIWNLCDPSLMACLVFRPQVGHSETVKATAGRGSGSHFTIPKYTRETPAGAQRGGSNWNAFISIPRLPALMDVSLVWKDNEIEGGEDFGLPWRIWTSAKNTNRLNPSVLLCVLYMFWIRQQPLLSAEKQISLPSIVSQWPWCVSPLPSVQGTQLLFIRLPLHVVWPLLKLPCLIFFPPLNVKVHL